MKVFTRKNKYDTQFSSRMINFIAIIFMIAYKFKLNSFKQVEHINHKTKKQENKKKRSRRFIQRTNNPRYSIPNKRERM